ncbi:hypothetical protein V1264_023834 [Littorina saxatilis]
MDYPCHAISPGLSQASCGSPNYDSEFTSNGSPGQCSLRSDMSMSPGRMSPGTLQEKYSVFDKNFDQLTSYALPASASGLHFQSQDSVCSDSKSNAPCSPLNPLSPHNPLSPNALGVSPSSLLSSGLSTPSAVLNHTNFMHAKFELKAFTRPSTTVDVDTTSTPYSDATKPKKPAKEGRIKRPMNAFMVWAQQERRLLTESKPELHNAEISKHLGHVWKLMLEEEKTVWREEAARLKELHDREFPFYKYQPRKNKNKIQKKPVKTESGRVSKPTGKNREVTTKPPAKASRSKAGSKSKASGGKKNVASSQVSTTTVGAEVNSSLVSMLQAGPQQRFQNLGAVASFPSETIVKSEPILSKQFNRVVIDDEFRKGVRESQKVPSSTEITPPAQSGDLVSVDFPTHSFHNPAFRPTEMYQAPTPSPVSTHNTNASLSLADHAADMGMVIKTEIIDEDTALLLDELPHAVTPAAVMKVGDSLIVSQYQSGATVTYNRDTKECRFNNLAPLQAISDLSSIDYMCMNALDVDPTACEEIDNIRNIISISDINWEGIAQDAVTDNDFTMINEEDIEYVSDTLPDTIFAETPSNYAFV